MDNRKDIRSRVVLQEKGRYRIRSEKGECWAEISGKFRFESSRLSDFPAVGDYVIASWPEDGNTAVISMLFPRKSCFLRKAAGTENREQVVAANVDTVFLCMSLNRDFNVRRLERYLATVWDSGAVPMVLLTKKDLCDDPENCIRAVEEVAAGVEILLISSLDGSWDELLPFLETGKTYAVMGSSGVGKSTLINCLTGKELLRTDGIRNDDRGHHTTTHRELIELPNGAYMIDTPGMRELGMWDSESGIDTVFADLEQLGRRCRFPDCSHTSEPGCAVLQARQEGTVSGERWAAYEKLKLENAYTAEQSAYRKEKKEKFKEIAKFNRKNQRKY